MRTDILALVPPSKRLLDVGGGTGATAAALKACGRCEVAGVVDREALPAAAGIDFACRGDLADPAVLAGVTAAHGPFDTMLCLDVFEHLAAPEALAVAIRDALVPGGTLVASIPNVRHISVLAPLLFRGRWDYADSGVLDRTHLRFFVQRNAIALLAESGLEIMLVQRSGTGSRKARLLNWLTLGLIRDLFTMQYFIVARRPEQANETRPEQAPAGS